jgi:hypothetical protein
MSDLFSNVWGNKSEVIVDDFLDITLSVGYWELIYYVYLWSNILTDCALCHRHRRYAFMISHSNPFNLMLAHSRIRPSGVMDQ